MICACRVMTSSSAARPAAVSGFQKRAIAGFSNARLTAVTCWEMSAWLICVLRVINAFTTDIPTLDPILRARLKSPAPFVRFSGGSVEHRSPLVQIGTTREIVR
jgi:hypothetical protein